MEPLGDRWQRCRDPSSETLGTPARAGGEGLPTSRTAKTMHVACGIGITAHNQKRREFTCKDSNYKLSHETKTVESITLAPTQEDIRRWDAAAALKTALTKVARQFQPDWI